MDKLEIARRTVKFLAKAGSSSATATIVANNRPTSDVEILDTYYKIAAFVGGMAAGWMVGDAVGEYAGKTFDEFVEKITD